MIYFFLFSTTITIPIRARMATARGIARCCDRVRVASTSGVDLQRVGLMSLQVYFLITVSIRAPWSSVIFDSTVNSERSFFGVNFWTTAVISETVLPL